MRLSKLQIQLVNEIAEHNVLHVYHLLEKHCDLEPVNRGMQSYDIHTINNRMINLVGSNIVYVPRDANSAKAAIVEYIALVKLLEKERLIIEIPYTVRGLIFPLARRVISGNSSHLDHDQFLQGLVASIDQIEIYPLPALAKFIQNDFVTEREIKELAEQNKYNEERKDRKTSQKLTIALALISIVFSIATAIFNFYTYDKQRSVTITNSGAFKDTTKVLLLQNTAQTLRPDSTNKIKTKPGSK